MTVSTHLYWLLHGSYIDVDNHIVRQRLMLLLHGTTPMTLMLGSHLDSDISFCDRTLIYRPTQCKKLL